MVTHEQALDALDRDVDVLAQFYASVSAHAQPDNVDLWCASMATKARCMAEMVGALTEADKRLADGGELSEEMQAHKAVTCARARVFGIVIAEHLLAIREGAGQR